MTGPQGTDPAAPRPPGRGPGPAAAPPVAFAKPAPMHEGDYQWVYLWGWPIRAMHWIAAVCLVVLAVSGLYIGKPYFLTGGEASSHFLMGKVRLLHFGAAGLLVATGIVRSYWLFAGNRFERWTALFPVRPRDWVNMWQQFKFYALIRKAEAPRYLGHNPMQQLSYTGIYLLTLAVALTGFTLYGESSPSGFFHAVFAWVPSLLGGLQRVRFLHHISVWLYLIFIPIHIYLSLRAELLERTGVVSSIVSGGAFVPRNVKHVDE